MSKITPYQISNALVIGTEGTDHNPLPTTAADSPSSSVTFTLPVACYLYVTFGCNMQINTSLTCYLYLNVDGSDVKQCRGTNAVAGQDYREVSRRVKLTLAAGSHTIKLRGMATQSNAAVNIAPYWYADVVPQ